MPASVPVPDLPSRPSTDVSPSLAALSITLRVSASKPILTIPPASVEIAMPFFTVAAADVPVPGLKVSPVPTATVLAVVSLPDL